jgi:hypothetical protein
MDKYTITSPQKMSTNSYGISVSIPKRIQHALATTLQIADFKEATFYIFGECFQISFGKWPKEPQERIHTICTTSLLRKR